jgi:hypothetical protein
MVQEQPRHNICLCRMLVYPTHPSFPTKAVMEGAPSERGRRWARRGLNPPPMGAPVPPRPEDDFPQVPSYGAKTAVPCMADCPFFKFPTQMNFSEKSPARGSSF